jgi:hypothetical protein
MAPELQKDLEHFSICGTCRTLDERGRSDGRNQRCACRPRDTKPWPRFDFNERLCLCQCCAREALPSGSRWSLFFCRECQLMAMGASIWAQRLVMPIGHHSLVHTFVTANANTEARVANLLATVKTVSAGTDVLNRWAKKSVAHNLKRLGLRGRVKLTDYLAAVEKSDKLRSRFDTFTELCAFVRG